MGVMQRIRASLGIKAKTLTPAQMTGQRSKSINRQDPFGNMFSSLAYKGDELGYEDYERMLEDPQIKSGFELIRMFLLSRKLIITPASEDEQDVEIAEILEDMFDDMKYPMRKIRNDLYTAIIYGYSVGEVIWEPEEDSSLIKISRIRPIPISTLKDCFRYDDNGDLDAIVQTIEGEDEIEIPAAKCLVYTYDEKFGNREGTSILDAVYDNWFMKQKLLEWWNTFLQKHEGPTLMAKIENPMFKDEMLDQLEEVTEGRTNITIGMNDDISVLESSHRGEGFKEAINYHDTMIFRKMNIGTMILGQESGKGAYAQSATQMDTLSIFLDGVHADIAAELQSKIKELADMNWSNIETYPTLEFESFEEEDLLGLLAALDPLIKSFAIDPADPWFKQVVARVVDKFTDVDMSEYLQKEEEEPEQVQPTQEEIGAPKPEVATDINKIFEIPSKKPEEQVQPANPVGE